MRNADVTECMMKCRICDNTRNNKELRAKEMMFGNRDEFIYFQCAQCNCLQILDFPPNISKYYPMDYGSFAQELEFDLSKNLLKYLANRQRVKYAIDNKGLIGRMIFHRYPIQNLRSVYPLDLGRESRILDVGCGNGFSVYWLNAMGFKDCLGIDPYIDNDVEYKNGTKILKTVISNINGKWDLIMFHHSLEHIPNPLDTFQDIARLLKPDGCCLIRMPTVSSYAWEHYGTNWVQLDAPRHFFIHSMENINILASKTGLKLCDVIYDSTKFQFIGSEQYLRNIPMKSNESYYVNPSKSIFSKKDIKSFKQRAKELNAENLGDQAAFYFRKS